MSDVRHNRNKSWADPIEMQRCLSACGWRWSPDHRAWYKGDSLRHAISEEALADLLEIHPWIVPFLRSALIDGAVGFRLNVEQTSDGLVANVKWLKEDQDDS